MCPADAALPGVAVAGRVRYQGVSVGAQPQSPPTECAARGALLCADFRRRLRRHHYDDRSRRRHRFRPGTLPGVAAAAGQLHAGHPAQRPRPQVAGVLPQRGGRCPAAAV
eukprot:ctg_2858.g785